MKNTIHIRTDYNKWIQCVEIYTIDLNINILI